MTVPTHRNGDSNSGGGVVTSIPQSTVYANGKLVCVNGSKGTGHGPAIHAAMAWATAGGSSTVFVEEIPVNGTGNSDTCGHARAAGSPDVFVDA